MLGLKLNHVSKRGHSCKRGWLSKLLMKDGWWFLQQEMGAPSCHVIRYVTDDICILMDKECRQILCFNVESLTRSVSQHISSNDTDINSLKNPLKFATVRRYEDKWENKQRQDYV